MNKYLNFGRIANFRLARFSTKNHWSGLFFSSHRRRKSFTARLSNFKSWSLMLN